MKIKGMTAAKRFLVIFFPLFIFLSFLILARYRIAVGTEKSMVETEAIHHVDFHNQILNWNFESVLSDLMFLSQSGVLNKYLESGSAERREVLADELWLLLETRRIYERIIYTNEEGKEISRAGPPAPEKSEELISLSVLREGQVVVSFHEPDMIYYWTRPMKNPAISFSTPVFDREGLKRGIMTLHYSGVKLAADDQKISIEGYQGYVILLSSLGKFFLISGPDEMPESKDIEFNFPESLKKVFAAERGQFYDKAGLFTFRTFSSGGEGIKPGRGPELVDEIDILGEDIYNLKIISFIPSEVLQAAKEEYLKEQLRRYLVIYVLTFGAIIAIALILARISRNRKTAEERFRTISQAANDAIIMMDSGGSISYWNPAAENIFGYSAKEAIGRELHRLIVPEEYYESFEKGFEKFRETGTGPAIGKTVELSGIRKDGTEFPVELSLSAMKIGDEWHSTGIIRDISRRKQAEEALQKAKEDAETANRLKSEFLANMSHEIRTPMNSILGFTALLLEDEKDKEKRKDLEIIKQSGNDLLNLLNDILDFSKIEAGKLTLSSTYFSLENLVSHIHNMFKIRAGENNISFRVKIDDTVPEMLAGDEQRINQIILNLLSNAFKFTKAGSIMVHCSYREGILAIKVSDTGIGIPKENQGSIFSSFEQVDGSTSREYGGTGLGLAITKKLTELMGGTIALESETGAGSTFTVVLPLTVEEGIVVSEKMIESWLAVMGGDPELEKIVLEGIADLPARMNQLEEAVQRNESKDIKHIAHDLKGMSGNLGMREVYELALKMDEEADRKKGDLQRLSILHEELKSLVNSIPGKYFKETEAGVRSVIKDRRDFKILLAEDNKMNQRLIEALLDRMDLECRIAANGKIALDMLREERYDLLILDMQMPEMDGMETIRHIRSDEELKDLYVIALTAHAMKGDAEKIINAGCNAYLAKPIEKDKLNEMINSLLVNNG